MRRGVVIALSAAGAAGAWAAWSRVGRSAPRVPVDVDVESHAFHGEDQGAGSLLALQPLLRASDYASAERLLAVLDGLLAHAKERGAVTDRTVVVLPEHLATWLVASGEKRAVYTRRDMQSAVALVAARNLPSFVRALVRAPVEDAAAYALFRCKADDIARAWTLVGETLARRYGVTLVAGSGLLPSPSVEGGRLVVGDGPLRHVALVFGPDGSVLGEPVAKCFVGPEEASFVTPGVIDRRPTFDTPAGRLGVLLGRDAFDLRAHVALAEAGAALLAVPAYLAGLDAWSRRWAGVATTNTWTDVDPSDDGHLDEGEAWLKYGPPAQVLARAQVTAFFKGCVWDRCSEGAALTTADGDTRVEPLVEGGSWVCRWLPRVT